MKYLPVFLLMSTAPLFAQNQPTAPAADAKKDPVLLLLRSAYEKYAKRDLNGAAADVDLVQKKLAELRSGSAAILLADLEGWVATNVEKSDLMGFGSGRVVKRNYVKGKAQFTAELTTDSTLVEKLGPLVTSDLATQGPGVKKERIEGCDAVIRETPLQTELSIWLGGGVSLKLTAKSDNMKPSDLSTVVRKFDLKAMERLQPEKEKSKNAGK